MDTKECSKCGKTYPATDQYFRKVKSCINGIGNVCIPCKNAYNRQYKKDHTEEIKKYREETSKKMKEWHKQFRKEHPECQKEYYQKNKERLLKMNKEYRVKNIEWYKAYNKRYYQENKEKIAKYTKEIYYPRYKERAKVNAKKWRKSNPEKARIVVNRRRARKKNLDFNYTAKTWEKCKKYFGNKCAYCGEDAKLQQEHFIPLSKGGEYTRNNILAACSKCNISKNDSDFFEWYPKQKFYSINREHKILKYLNYKGEYQQLMML